MIDCTSLFFSVDPDLETLHSRLKISDSLLTKGVARKNDLIDFMREELESTFECTVKFWLQGSYKSHTLIKPESKFSSFDIDIGIYLFFDAEQESISASEVKQALKEALLSYSSINNECKIQESKNACEGIVFPNLLTIDTPIYFKTEESLKLATDKGWIDSDPQSIQKWLTDYHADVKTRAQMKRIVRYLKAWANIQWQDSPCKKIPSLAINVLVAEHLSPSDSDEIAFLNTSISICKNLGSRLFVESPLDGSNLLGMNQDSEAYAHQKLDQLKHECLLCSQAPALEKAVRYSNLFEHYFPQYEIENLQTATALPALTTAPELSIARYDKNDKHVETQVKKEMMAYKGESLTFTLINASKFPPYAEVKWTVRNLGKQASDANDIGHKIVSGLGKSHRRGCAYTGDHTMECMVIGHGVVLGVASVRVKVKPQPTILKKRVFKGLRR